MNVITDVLSRLEDGEVIDYEEVIDVPDDLSEKEQKSYKKEKINGTKALVRDFPLFLKLVGTTGLKIKRSEITSDNNKLFNRLSIYYKNDKTFYVDKTRNASSKAKFPFIETPAEDGYLSSATLGKEKKIDFVGNSACSQYYKLLARLISNDGQYLLPKYNIEDFPSDFQNRIKQVEAWYRSLDKKDNDAFLDDYTAQVLFPFEDSYVSITPVQNMALINNVIKTSQKLNNDYFETKKEIKKEIGVLKKEIAKLFTSLKKQKDINAVTTLKKEISDKKKLLNELNEKDKLLSNIKRTPWQQMNSKTQNISLNAPATKNGIFLADAPSYNYQVASEMLQDKNLSNYIAKNIRSLYFMSKSFKKICDNFYELMHVYGNISKDLNIDEKNKISSLLKRSYNYFIQAVDIETINKEFIEIFLDQIVSNCKKYDLTLVHTTKVYFIECIEGAINE